MAKDGCPVDWEGVVVVSRQGSAEVGCVFSPFCDGFLGRRQSMGCLSCHGFVGFGFSDRDAEWLLRPGWTKLVEGSDV